MAVMRESVGNLDVTSPVFLGQGRSPTDGGLRPPDDRRESELRSGGASPRPLKPGHVFAGLVGASAALRCLAGSVHRLAQTQSAVLVQGETGTGKDVVARAIHGLGPRARKPFVVVDCGALAPTLIASQIFGHERGAFTGADARREGAFEIARGGVLFLDEIGDLPLEMQPALLGVLERKTFRRLGGKDDIATDVRVVSATHLDLQAAMQGGKFRADLYYRLAAVVVDVPPLRERPDDVEPLVRHFAGQFTGCPHHPLTERMMRRFQAARWPGNVRELRNTVERVLLDAHEWEGETPSRAAGALATERGVVAVAPYKTARRTAVEGFERKYLRDLMTASAGNASCAARLANMDRPYLLSLLRKHGLR